MSAPDQLGLRPHPKDSELTRVSSDKAESAVFPLASFTLPARVSASGWQTVPVIVLVAALVRWGVGLWPHSGMGVPPMFGDFEAQRHWMEVAIHVPMTDWYFFDLGWWGLDYPPLTAYHSWLIGKIGSLIDPSWFALQTSRGAESDNLRLFMRSAALISDLAIFFPAVAVFVRRIGRARGTPVWERAVVLAAIVLAPPGILIDHGHFQFNTVMAGFFVAAVTSLVSRNRAMASVLFVASLCFKQMALFWALPMFVYLLADSISAKWTIRWEKLAAVATATTAAFVVFVGPMICAAMLAANSGMSPPSKRAGIEDPPLLARVLAVIPFNVDQSSILYAAALQATQIVHRLFPFARGLFEDKVANMWCFLHVFHKLHRYPQASLQLAATGATVLLSIPPAALLFREPSIGMLVPAAAASGWAFFLAGFQVHEKSVLLPLIPMSLLFATHGLCARIRGWVGFANLVAGWTMFPLLSRDGLRIPYVVTMALWAWLLGLPPVNWRIYFPKVLAGSSADGLYSIEKLVHTLVYLAMIIWHVFELVIPPPEGKPDLWPVLNVLIGTPAFGMCYLWCVSLMVSQGKGAGKVSKSKLKRN